MKKTRKFVDNAIEEYYKVSMVKFFINTKKDEITHEKEFKKDPNSSIAGTVRRLMNEQTNEGLLFEEEDYIGKGTKKIRKKTVMIEVHRIGENGMTVKKYICVEDGSIIKL